MSHIIPEPAADAPILDWAKPVTQALNELRDKRGAMARNARPGALPRLRPWEIHFFPAQTEEDEDIWGVYLPGGSLNIAGAEVTPTDSSGTALVAAGAAYPGYYAIPVSSETAPSAFWLHIYAAEEQSEGQSGGTEYSATLTDDPQASPSSGQETLTSIRLCSIASSGAITQLIVGAIVLTPCDCGVDDEDPTPDEDDPYGPHTDPCEHDPISGNYGGVAADYDSTGSGGADYGGVSADGGVHYGDNDCNCP